MSEIKDSTIHEDGIYDIDKSCRMGIFAMDAEERLIFALMAVFLLVR